MTKREIQHQIEEQLGKGGWLYSEWNCALALKFWNMDKLENCVCDSIRSLYRDSTFSKDLFFPSLSQCTNCLKIWWQLSGKYTQEKTFWRCEKNYASSSHKTRSRCSVSPRPSCRGRNNTDTFVGLANQFAKPCLNWAFTQLKKKGAKCSPRILSQMMILFRKFEDVIIIPILWRHKHFDNSGHLKVFSQCFLMDDATKFAKGVVLWSLRIFT